VNHTASEVRNSPALPRQPNLSHPVYSCY